MTYLYATNVNTIFRASEGIESGTVAVNNVAPDSFFAPYGGWKQSGLAWSFRPTGWKSSSASSTFALSSARE